MKFRVFPFTIALGLMVSMLGPSILAQQSGQQQSGQVGSGTAVGANGSNGSNNTGSNPSTNTTSRSRTNPSPDNQSQFQRQQILVLSGSVILDDGTPPPLGAVIERNCGGRTIKEAYVSPNGSFDFQVGANNNVLPDASDAGPITRLDSMGTSSGPSTGMGWGPATYLTGCDLRARLGGYRSSTLFLTLNQTMGVVDVGTIVLYPAARVSGTTVSVTNLQAPKEAKKALDRAEKALQRKKFDEAEVNLQAALKVYPSYATAWFRLGEVYEQSKRHEEARSALAKALETDKNYVNPYIELARIAAVESKWQEAADLTDHALELDPVDFPDGYYLNMLADYNLNKLDGAERSARRLERLNSLHQIPQAFLILAAVLDRKRDFAGEADQLRQYLKCAPQAANVGEVRSRLQKLQKDKGQQADSSKTTETLR